jgi:pimeloyl-ACP methyl ester carboxylesterase
VGPDTAGQERTITGRSGVPVYFRKLGRGDSGPMPDSSQITLEGETEDLDLVLRHCDLERVALFGWSYHAAVAADYASRHPELVERLILSGPMAPSYSGEAARVLQSRLDPQGYRGPDAVAARRSRGRCQKPGAPP